MNISPKTAGATGGAAVANAVVVVALYFFKITPPADVVADLCLLVGAIGAFVGAYIPASHYSPKDPPSQGGTP